MSNQFDYKINVRLNDNNIAAVVDGINRSFDGVTASVDRSARSFGGFDGIVERVKKNLDFTQFTQVLSNVNQGLQSLNAPAVQFEQAMADVQAITGVVGKEFEDLSRTARQVGVDSGLGAEASAQAFSILAGQIDVPTESLKELHKETIKLAQAGALDLQSSANAVAGTLNQFGLEASEAARVVNVLAAGSRAGGAEVVDLAESFKVSGAAAAAAGLSVEETAGAIEVLANNQTKGAEAGTALRNVVTALQTRLGIDISQTGLAPALLAIRQKMDGMASSVERTTFLAKTFGRENLTAAQFLITNAEAVADMTAAVTGSNAAQEQAEIRTQTWAHKMEVAKAKIDEWKIGIIDATGGALPFVEVLSSQAVTISQLLPLFDTLKGGITSFVSALPRVIVSVRSFTSVQAALNAVMAANPIGAVVAAVAALTAASVFAYKHCASFRDTVDGLWTKLKELFSTLSDLLVPVLQKLGSALLELGKVIIPLVIKPLEWLLKLLGWLVEKINDAAAALGKFFGLSAGTNKPLEAAASASGQVRENLDSALASAGLLNKSTQEMRGLWGDVETSTKKVAATIPEIKLQGGKKGNKKEVITDLETVAGIGHRINALQTALNKAKGDERVGIAKEIAMWQDKLDLIKAALKMETEMAKAANKKIRQDGKLEGSIDIGTPKPLAVKAPKIFDGKAVKDLIKIDELYKRVAKTIEKSTKSAIARMRELQGNIAGVGNLMGALGNIVGGSAGAWLQWGAAVMQSIAAVLPELVNLFGKTAAVTAAESGKFGAELGPIGVAAAVAATLATLLAIPSQTAHAFADGGVVYGTTYAMVGEYPGAANNPEVIAPLNKLQELIKPAQGGPAGEVVFRIRRGELVGILSKDAKIKKYT